MGFKAENINAGRSACAQRVTNVHIGLSVFRLQTQSVGGVFHEVIPNFKQRLCETWPVLQPPSPTDLGEFGEWISIAEGAC